MKLIQIRLNSAGTGLRQHGVYFNNGISDWVSDGMARAYISCGAKILQELTISDAIAETLFIFISKYGTTSDRVLQVGMQTIMDSFNDAPVAPVVPSVKSKARMVIKVDDVDTPPEALHRKG